MTGFFVEHDGRLYPLYAEKPARPECDRHGFGTKPGPIPFTNYFTRCYHIGDSYVVELTNSLLSSSTIDYVHKPNENGDGMKVEIWHVGRGTAMADEVFASVVERMKRGDPPVNRAEHWPEHDNAD